MTLAIGKMQGQDIQFSQFYNAVQYQNPAFAGSTHYFRYTANQRIQWPNIESKYITSLFAADMYISKKRLGLGGLILRDWQANTNIISNEFQIQASEEISLTNKATLRLGVQSGIVNRSINYTDFRFTQDFDNNGYKGNTYGDISTTRINYFDLSAGILYYNTNTWLGIALHHITRPTQTFFSNDSRLPIKLSVTSGYKFVFDKLKKKQEGRFRHFHNPEISLSPVVHYKHQGQFDQLDIGATYQYHELILGIWYRGIPLKKYRKHIHNNESVIVSIGYIVDNLRFAYSYDMVISKLSGNANPRGAHELSLTMLFPYPRNKPKPMKILPCPSF